MNWIKKHPRAFAAYIAGILITSGILIIIPKSPLTLIVLGVAILFCIGVSLLDDAIN